MRLFSGFRAFRTAVVFRLRGIDFAGALALLVGWGVASGCGPLCPPQNVSFSQCVVPTLQANCGGSGCHGGDNPAFGLLLEGNFHDRIVNVMTGAGVPFVKPKAPDQSYLLWKLLPPSALQQIPDAFVSGEHMPLGRPALSDGQLEMLRAWIREGAPNN